MQVSEVMTSNVKLASPEDTLQAIALSMSELDAGALPVGENDRLVGMVTDRDIVVRAISKGLDPGRTTAREVMSAEIYYCFVDDDVQDVAQSLSEWRVRRLPVLDADKRLVGIVSLGDVSKGAAPEHSGAALRDISQQDGSQARR
jgi:CBS domain-containing protein